MSNSSFETIFELGEGFFLNTYAASKFAQSLDQDPRSWTTEEKMKLRSAQIHYPNNPAVQARVDLLLNTGIELPKQEYPYILSETQNELSIPAWKKEAYLLLGLDINSDHDLETVKKAYRAKAKELHPDTTQLEHDTSGDFDATTNAYNTLIDSLEG